jgi:hypothetical protein
MPVAESFVGGMNVPLSGGFGRLSASFPLAELVIDDGWVTLQPRWFVAALIGPFRVPVRGIVAAYPLRKRLGGGGVGLTTSDDQTAYFWALGAHDQVLHALACRGVTIDPSARSTTAIWRLRSPAATVTQPAALRPWIVRLLPIGVAAATISMIRAETQPGPLLWRAWIAVTWLIAIVTAVPLWRAGRRPRS